ncbi:hypothetical protein [Streptomyces hiroshimensis]|uniref:hypothetical protein n=1 Tax=Streptomyces hiroshimensis TaxID=66424 RepID=UPI0016751A57|nr:hypothetical protein [Streptomyces hiroshimensis]
MARSSSGVIVAALTAAALAGVGFLAFQAEAAPDKPHSSHAAGAGASGKGEDKGKGDAPGDNGSGTGSGKDDGAKAAVPDVPAGSGTGKRVVYALGQKRVWLVGTDGKATHSFEVAPSAVNPVPGSYAVTSRSATGTGSDGKAIEHVVRFHSDPAGVVFGFSAAVDGSLPDPTAAPKKTGAVREMPADGRAMWDFALNGTKVVVVA